jgi:hypothetical protein
MKRMRLKVKEGHIGPIRYLKPRGSMEDLGLMGRMTGAGPTQYAGPTGCARLTDRTEQTSAAEPAG